MKKILALALSCTCAFATFAQTNYFFDPFADATSKGGTAYNVGDQLAGQSTGVNVSWAPIGTNYVSSNAVTITNYTLAMPTGLPASTGNAVLLRALTNGPGGRLNMGTNYSTNAATLYYSVVFQVLDISTLNLAGFINNGGAFNMGFNNTYAAGQNNNPTVYGAPLYIGRTQAPSADGYVLGVGRGTGSTGRYWEADPSNPGTHLHSTNDVIFAVVEYEIVPGTANDIARLWVNPDPASFGNGTAPTPTVEVLTSGDADIASLNSFLMANRSSLCPTMVADELRIGYTWAAVTGVPPITDVPVPTLSISLVDPNTVQLSWRGDSTGFTLQGTSQLLGTNTPWANLGGTATTSGTNFIQADTVSGMKFYRLIK